MISSKSSPSTYTRELEKQKKQKKKNNCKFDIQHDTACLQFLWLLCFLDLLLTAIITQRLKEKCVTKGSTDKRKKGLVLNSCLYHKIYIICKKWPLHSRSKKMSLECSLKRESKVIVIQHHVISNYNKATKPQNIRTSCYGTPQITQLKGRFNNRKCLTFPYVSLCPYPDTIKVNFISFVTSQKTWITPRERL